MGHSVFWSGNIEIGSALPNAIEALIKDLGDCTSEEQTHIVVSEFNKKYPSLASCSIPEGFYPFYYEEHIIANPGGASYWYNHCIEINEDIPSTVDVYGWTAWTVEILNKVDMYVVDVGIEISDDQIFEYEYCALFLDQETGEVCKLVPRVQHVRKKEMEILGKYTTEETLYILNQWNGDENVPKYTIGGVISDED